MSRILEKLQSWLNAGYRAIGEVAIQESSPGWLVCHRDDADDPTLRPERVAAACAEQVALRDGNDVFRPLKTAPGLRRGWVIEASDLATLRLVLDGIYPGALGLAAAWEAGNIEVTSMRETVNRQTGMYRVSGKITSAQAGALVREKCNLQTGCLRGIIWELGDAGASLDLPEEKRSPSQDPLGRAAKVIPLVCREFCNYQVAEARRVVKAAERAATATSGVHA